jgi:uncharacterized ion transporter superfamily protein YfcC
MSTPNPFTPAIAQKIKYVQIESGIKVIIHTRYTPKVVIGRSFTSVSTRRICNGSDISIKHLKKILKVNGVRVVERESGV